MAGIALAAFLGALDQLVLATTGTRTEVALPRKDVALPGDRVTNLGIHGSRLTGAAAFEPFPQVFRLARNSTPCRFAGDCLRTREMPESLASLHERDG